MAKILIICIDGTGNDPDDVIEHYGESELPFSTSLCANLDAILWCCIAQ